jgi:hypothetical protein
MNEKIKEMMQQTGTDISGKWMSLEQVEKLSELIVKECADIATINSHQWNSAGSFILTHFGVEEVSVDQQLRNRSTYFGNNP